MDATEVILDFLRTNSAADFAKILYNVPLLYSASKDPNLSMILAPSDTSLHRLATESGKSLLQLQQNRYGIDIFANHVSTLPTQKLCPMVISINQQQYGSSEADILALEPQATTIIGHTVIIVINRIILHDNQLARAFLQRTAGPFEILKADRGFKVMIDQGYLKGYELVKLCSSNPEVGSLCDNLDFDLLLRRDYADRALSKAVFGMSARDLYFKHAMGYRVVTNISNHGNIGRFRSIDGPEGVIDVKVGMNFLAMLTITGKVFLKGYIESTNNNKNTSISFGPRDPFQLHRIPPITKIAVSGNGLTLLDMNGRFWVYGSLQTVIFTVKYYAAIDETYVSVLKALQYEDAFTGRWVNEYPNTFVTSPTLLSGIQADLMNIPIPQLPVIDFVQILNDKLIIIFENQLPEHYGEAGYFSGEIKQVTQKMDRVVKEVNGPIKIYHNNSPQIEIIDESSFGGESPRDIVNVQHRTVLDGDGYVWSAVRYVKEGNKQKWYFERTIYDAEPDLRFVAIHGNYFDSSYAISEDGRLFKNSARDNIFKLQPTVVNLVAMSIRNLKNTALNNLAFLVLKDF